MKIKSLEIENFKLFDKKFSKIRDISDADLVLLNGPNGYGKTSIFDAIEFALIGSIKRINKYSEDLGVKKSEAYDRKILIADESKIAYIKLFLEDEANIIEIQRMYNPDKVRKNKASKENNPYKIFDKFERRLFVNGQELKGEAANKALAEYHLNQIEDFYDKCCFLSQDEHLGFLKEANKDKASALEFLFEIPSEHQKELERVDSHLKAIKNNNKTKDLGYIAKLEKKMMEEINPEIEKLELDLKKTDPSNVDKIKYECLFSDQTIFWDKENLILDGTQYDEAMQEIEKLQYFSNHKVSCCDYLYNKPFKGMLASFTGSDTDISKRNPLEYAYRYYSLAKDEELIETKYSVQCKYQVLKGQLKNRKLDNINWTFILEEKLLEQSDVKSIKEKLVEITEIKRTQGIISGVITNINNTRTSLMKHVSDAMDESIIDDKICPLCGNPFTERQELEQNIKKETDVLQGLCDDSAKRIVSIIDILYKDYFDNILKAIEERSEDIVQDNLYKKLQEVKRNKSAIKETKELLQKLEIKLPDKYEDDIVKVEKGYQDLMQTINDKLKKIPVDIESQLDAQDFIHQYEKYYGKSKEKFDAITTEMLSSKSEYIKMLFYNTGMKVLGERRKELKRINDRIAELNRIYQELSHYRDAIQKGIDNYKRKIIQDIEPILYVYTAKILQQKFNGKSIFISSKDNMENIQFINSVTDNQDILYTMSSGQLAAVSLSFLLCMNQVYADQALPILLIDDPIQTIDDVNMVGLIDILRYEFADRQIFISTHEQKFEWYLKYKYEKADKNLKSFNMKNLML